MSLSNSTFSPAKINLFLKVSILGGITKIDNVFMGYIFLILKPPTTSISKSATSLFVHIFSTSDLRVP